MTSGKATRCRRPGPPARRGGGPARRRWLWAAVAAVAVVAVLYAVFRTASGGDAGSASGSGGSGYAYQVGRPGPGQPAPEFTLASTVGGQRSLAAYRGRSVLLYFQEGLMCQPCWEQITDLEANRARLAAAGIDQVVSITTDPVDLVARKAADMGLATPVLSDPDLSVSTAYQANLFGMMGTSRDGHSFILVGPDGTIRWRADYGGAPKYTMFLPTDAVLADLRHDTGAGA